MEINKECGNRLRECFEESDFKTQQELAESAGFSSVYINNIMTGKKPMTITAAKILSEKLGVLENYLLCKTNSKTDEERGKIIEDAITDMETCISAFAKYNGLDIEECLFVTDKGDFVPAKRKFLACPRYTKEDLLKVFCPYNCNAVDVKYRVNICGNIYIVDYERITEIFSFVTEYFQIQRSRLSREMEHEDIYLNIAD